MARLRFDPRGSNPYVENAMNLLQKMAMYDWEQQRGADIKQKRQQQILDWLKKNQGLSGTDTDMGIYPKGITSEGEMSFGIDRPQSVIDPDTGKVLYKKPEGSVFKPRARTTGASLRVPTQSGMQTTAAVEGRGIVPTRPYFLQPRKERQGEGEILSEIDEVFGEGKQATFPQAQEQTIQANMDYYGKSREEVIEALKKAGKL